MLGIKKLRNNNFGIYGLGINGIATSLSLKKSNHKIFCWDDNKLQRKKAIKLRLPVINFFKKKFKKNLNFIIPSPGIDIKSCKHKKYLDQNKKKIITDIDLFLINYPNEKVIAITGTNGKSTTCKLLEKIFTRAKYKVQLGGNIGKPILSLKNLKNNLFIFELSSYQLDHLKNFGFNHSAILNISADHLDRHKSIYNYIRIKSKIFYHQKKNDFFYIGSNNKYSNNILNIYKKKKIESKLEKVPISLKNKIKNKIKNKYLMQSGYIENLSFAIKIASKFRINKKILINSINSFRGLPHRQELIYSNKKFTFINDSKATTFDAAKRSLQNYKNIYWIVGGLKKKGDTINLEKIKNNIKQVYAIGKSTRYFKFLFAKYFDVFEAKKLNTAVNKIFNEIKKNKVSKATILLSPAAASFDQYLNFETRGDHFKKLVKKKLKNNAYYL